MSERPKTTHESHKTSEKLTDHKNLEHAEKQRHNAAEKAKKVHSKIDLEALRAQAKAEATTDARKHVAQEKEEPKAHYGIHHALKTDAYKQTIHRVQQKLNKPSRTFSKVVHNKTVETISNIGAQTLARPSGVLGGSICAFVGSSVLLYVTKHYGFEYNYLMFFLLFIGGFALGGLLELIIWAVYSRRHRR